MTDRSYDITPEALAALEAELAQLEGEGRSAMAERIKTARAWGDLKENSEYHDAKDAQAHLETKIKRLQDRRRHAVLVEGGTTGGKAGMGSTVMTRDEASGREAAYEIVPATESNPAEGKVSIESPVARSLLGAKADDIIGFQTPRGSRKMRILSVK